MADYQIRETRWQQDSDALYALRHEVFVLEQQVPVALELDEHDALARHWLLERQGEVLATLRLLADGSIGRMAVKAGVRGRGLGRALLEHCIAAAGRDALPRLTLSAQCHAIGFYEKLGFVASGDIFMDAGIPHRHMSLAVSTQVPVTLQSPATHRRQPLEDIAGGILDLSQRARRELLIYSHSLQAEWFASQALITAVSAFARRHADSTVRLLVRDDQPLREQRHPLVTLAQRLPSAIGLRVCGEAASRDDASEQFLVADRRALLVIEHTPVAVASRWDNLPPLARDYQAKFTRLWEFAKPSPWLRPLP